MADVSNVDIIVVSTTNPDHIVPNIASLIQGHFGIKKTGVMDINRYVMKNVVEGIRTLLETSHFQILSGSYLTVQICV